MRTVHVTDKRNEQNSTDPYKTKLYCQDSQLYQESHQPHISTALGTRGIPLPPGSRLHIPSVYLNPYFKPLHPPPESHRPLMEGGLPHKLAVHSLRLEPVSLTRFSCLIPFWLCICLGGNFDSPPWPLDSGCFKQTALRHLIDLPMTLVLWPLSCSRTTSCPENGTRPPGIHCPRPRGICSSLVPCPTSLKLLAGPHPKAVDRGLRRGLRTVAWALADVASLSQGYFLP